MASAIYQGRAMGGSPRMRLGFDVIPFGVLSVDAFGAFVLGTSHYAQLPNGQLGPVFPQGRFA